MAAPTGTIVIRERHWMCAEDGRCRGHNALSAHAGVKFGAHIDDRFGLDPADRGLSVLCYTSIPKKGCDRSHRWFVRGSRMWNPPRKSEAVEEYPLTYEQVVQLIAAAPPADGQGMPLDATTLPAPLRTISHNMECKLPDNTNLCDCFAECCCAGECDYDCACECVCDGHCDGDCACECKCKCECKNYS